MIDTVCPACGATNHEILYPSYEGTTITSDHLVIDNCRLDNRCCCKCGLVFNAAGLRGNADAFYAKAYSLMLHSKTAEIKTWLDGAAKSQAEHSLRLFMEMAVPPERGRILEAGAGKGDFLDRFRWERPAWSIAAFEPGKAFEVLTARIPGDSVVRCGYEDYPLIGPFEAIIALGVLEHVENPLKMLRWIRERLTPDGVTFLRVPNFARNPNDLFCADHLTKFTLPSLRALAASAGLRLEQFNDSGIALFVLLRPDRQEKSLDNVFEENIALSRRNESFCRTAMECIEEARGKALAGGERFGIFGLAMSGLLAPFLLRFSPEGIAAYVDENVSFHGRNVHGRPVVGPDTAMNMGIRHVALTISPAYIRSVEEKLVKRGMTVHHPCSLS